MFSVTRVVGLGEGGKRYASSGLGTICIIMEIPFREPMGIFGKGREGKGGRGRRALRGKGGRITHHPLAYAYV